MHLHLRDAVVIIRIEVWRWCYTRVLENYEFQTDDDRVSKSDNLNATQSNMWQDYKANGVYNFDNIVMFLWSAYYAQWLQAFH